MKQAMKHSTSHSTKLIGAMRKGAADSRLKPEQRKEAKRLGGILVKVSQRK